MINIEIRSKKYRAYSEWSDITLDRFIELSKLAIPGKLENLWLAGSKIKSKDTKQKSIAEVQYKKAIEAITKDDMDSVFPAYYGKVIELLSEVPESEVKEINSKQRTELFENFMRGFVLSLTYSAPVEIKDGQVDMYEPPETTQFKLNRKLYLFPESLELYNESIPMADEKVITFAEASDIDLAIQDLRSEGINRLPMFMAIYCRRKGEEYNEKVALKRSVIFGKCNMDVVWTLFFLHRKAYSSLANIYDNVFSKGAGTGKSGDYNKSGLSNFGWRGTIYEVAQSGGLGTVKQVEQVNLYDFMSYLSYQKAQSKYNELTAARSESKRKAKGASRRGR